jgi:hypothetical protein
VFVETSVSPTLADAAAADPKALIQRGRDITGRLLNELDATTGHVGELEALITGATEDDRDGRRRHAMLQAVGLSTRAAVLKNLALAAKTLSEAAPGKKGDDEKRPRPSRFATPSAPRLVVDNERNGDGR